MTDSLFVLGDLARAAVASCRASELQAALNMAVDIAMQEDCNEFGCGIDGCSRTFVNLVAYESHVREAHTTHRCSVCRAGFASERFVSIHAQEAHDALFLLMAAKKRMYVCLLEECNARFRTARGRRLHMVDAHMYPKDFRFGPLTSLANGKAGARVESDRNDCDPVQNEGHQELPPALASSQSATKDKKNSVVRKQEICRFIATARGCRNGSACRFFHPSDTQGQPTTSERHERVAVDGDVDMLDGLSSALSSMRVAVPDEICFGAHRRGGGGRGRRGGGFGLR